VPKLPNGTGEATIVMLLLQWCKNRDSQVRALFFDIAASNTSIRSVDCGVIETRLGKNLLYLTS